MTIFLNSLSNSYKRFGEFEAPKYITWSHQNRSQLIRIPAATGENMRMELRSPDPCCNPYLAFSLLILAGLEGIKNKLPLQKATDINLFKANEEELKGLKSLPLTFEEAIFGAKSSDFLKENMPPEIYSRYLEEKEKEADFICKAGNDAQIEETLYFKTV